MRDYRINTDRLVNQLVPHYLGGRKLILFLQAILQPLNTLNQTWKEWADDKRIEAALTSQTIMLEYFLNRKFRKYFVDASQSIMISDGAVNGVPLYLENVGQKTWALYNNNETTTQLTTALRFKDEKLVSSDVSFLVCCPAINKTLITEAEMTAMISYYVDNYRIAGKTFKVIYL